MQNLHLHHLQLHQLIVVPLESEACGGQPLDGARGEARAVPGKHGLVARGVRVHHLRVAVRLREHGDLEGAARAVLIQVRSRGRGEREGAA